MKFKKNLLTIHKEQHIRFLKVLFRIMYIMCIFLDSQVKPRGKVYIFKISPFGDPLQQYSFIWKEKIFWVEIKI